MADEINPRWGVRTTIQPCQFHNLHKPTNHLNHVHHVWPLAEGGPDIPDNKVVICPTGHANVHDLIDHYKMLMGHVSYDITRQFSREERALAELGWKRMLRKEM